MATVFFKTTKTQDHEIEALMKQEGYTSKAEFFRFLLKFFKYNRPKESSDLDEAVENLQKTLHQLHKKGYFKNLPSAEEQLAEL